MRVNATLRKLLADQQAATAVEYGLILALVFLGMVGGVSALGSEGTGMWGRIENKAVSAMAGN
jgi:pilus assembly protein Flp/PilA